MTSYTHRRYGQTLAIDATEYGSPSHAQGSLANSVTLGQWHPTIGSLVFSLFKDGTGLIMNSSCQHISMDY